MSTKLPGRVPVFVMLFVLLTPITIHAESQIPEWVKINAGWWSDDTIDDNTFINGIEYLIKENTTSDYNEFYNKNKLKKLILLGLSYYIITFVIYKLNKNKYVYHPHHWTIFYIMAFFPNNIIESKGFGNCYLVGAYNGATVTGGTVALGKALGDMSGYTLTITSREKRSALIIEEGATTIFDALGSITVVDS
mgnify:CR=1 FL=1